MINKNNYSVYIHTFPNGKIYVGMTSCYKPEYRWNNGKGYQKNQLISKKIMKYGWDNIKRNILFTGLSKRDACKMEQELISKYNSCDYLYGYNISIGGGKHSIASKEKMRVARLGRKATLETRKKQSNSLKGIPRTDEWKANIGLGNKGKKHSVEQNEYMSLVKSKKIKCVETGKIFKNAKTAAHYLGYLNRGTNIQNVVNNENKTAYGFHWKYVEG